MKKENGCCFSWEDTKNGKLHSCSHKVYSDYDGQTYCVFHYPVIEDKERDIQSAFYDLIVKSNDEDDKFNCVHLRNCVFGGLQFRGEFKKSIDFSNCVFR